MSMSEFWCDSTLNSGINLDSSSRTFDQRLSFFLKYRLTDGQMDVIDDAELVWFKGFQCKMIAIVDARKEKNLDRNTPE